MKKFIKIILLVIVTIGVYNVYLTFKSNKGNHNPNPGPNISENTPDINNGGGNETPNRKITSIVTIVNGNESQTVTFTNGKPASIAKAFKSGFGCKGYFDEPSGGTMYIDGLGASIDNWSESNPTTLYAQWTPISEIGAMIINSSNVDFWYHLHFAYSSERCMRDFGNIYPTFKNACLGNPDKTLSLTLKCDGRDTGGKGVDWILYTKCEHEYNEGNMFHEQIIAQYQGKEYNNMPSSLTPITYSSTVSAREFAHFGVSLFISRGARTGDAYLIDSKVSLSFN